MRADLSNVFIYLARNKRTHTVHSAARTGGEFGVIWRLTCGIVFRGGTGTARKYEFVLREEGAKVGQGVTCGHCVRKENK